MVSTYRHTHHYSLRMARIDFLVDFGQCQCSSHRMINSHLVGNQMANILPASLHFLATDIKVLGAQQQLFSSNPALELGILG